MVNSEGAWNGDIPRYLVWKDIARRIRSSSNRRERSLATLAHGLSTPATLIALLVSKLLGPVQGVCRQALETSNLRRFSLTYFSKPAAFASPANSRIRSVISGRLLVASIDPPAP